MPLPPEKPPGGWPEENSQQRLLEAVGNRMREDFSRASTVADASWTGVRNSSTFATLGRFVREIGEDVQVETGDSRRGSMLA